MKTRYKSYNIKKECIKTTEKTCIKNIKNIKNLIFQNKSNENLELINKEKNKSIEYGTYIDYILNLSKLVQINIILKYRHVLKEIPSSQFILDIIINLPMKDCNPQDYKFIELIYILWKSELNNKIFI
jgi:hypothetical protein